MINSEIQVLLSDFRSAHGDNAVWAIFNSLCDCIIDNYDELINDKSLYQTALDFLSDLEDSLTNILYKHYIKATQHILKNEKTEFTTELEQYIQIFAEKYNEFTYDQAYKDIIELIVCLSKDDAARNAYYKKLSSSLTKLLPKSAFCAYVNYLTKTYKNRNIEIKALQQIIDIDPKWYVSYIRIGDIYFDQQKWQDAITYYEKGVAAGDLWKTSQVYFCLGWAYDKVKQYAESIENYKKCLEITPHYQCANNNIGYEYKKIKDFDQALLYFNKSIELGTDSSFPYRNKLETLIKVKRNDEAIAFATENPTHFKTKYYKELLSKVIGGKADMDKIFEGLTQTTENEYAGTISIDCGKSGLQLYAHQQDAIRDMSQKILQKDKYSGLLVLPTGGGKTLTATYWLMRNILDSGQKVIWLAHRHELLNQALAGFEKVSYADVARRKKQYNYRIISGQHDRPVHIQSTDDVIIASKTSLHRGFGHLAAKWLEENNHDVFLIIDEAHHAAAKEYRELIDKIREAVPSVKVLGLTATPFRTADGEQGLLKKIFYDDIAYKIDLRELINRGILSEPIFEEVETEIDMLRLFQTPDGVAVLERIEQDSFFDIESIGADIATKIAQNAERNNAIVSKYIENKDKYGKTLVFALNVDMAIALNAVFKARGVKSDFVVSDIRDKATGVTLSSKENIDKIRKFRSEELGEDSLDVLINVNILTEGTDLPKVQTVFLTRPTKSTILMTQMIGRALRGIKAGGTKDCYIVSFVDDWQNRIAWINPEKLFIDENADFVQHDPETQKMAMRLVSLQKIEEFAKIADGTLEGSIERMSFIERFPVGFYKFSYLLPVDSDEDEAVNCDILVYDCMQEAYRVLFDWLPTANLNDEYSAAQHINDTLFTETDHLIGYNKQDIVDIIRYFKQTDEIPEFIAFTERNDYDIARLAKYILAEKMDYVAQDEYISSEWNQSNNRWSAFYGSNNKIAFRKTITAEIDKILHPEDYEAAPVKPITQHEQRQIQDLTLYEIRQKFPELGEKIRLAIFEKYTDSDGYYFSAQSRYRSRNKLDFQIDHVVPMANGGKTVLDNLQLLTRAENLQKGAN